MALTRLPTRSPAPAANRRHNPLWRLKLRLQFTGWLQYLVSAFVAVPFLLIAGIGALIGVWPVLLVWVPLTVAGLLLVTMVLDLLTVKAGLRPTEPLPRRRDGLDAFDLMRARRSCRSFQSRDLTEAHRAELLAAVAAHTRPAEQIGTSPIRFEYVAGALTVWPVVGAHEFLVAIAPRDYDRLAIIDVGRSLERVVLHATRMGLGTCWIGPGADQASIVAHLGSRFDPERDHVVCVCAIGYRSRFKPLAIRAMQLIQHRRLAVQSLFFTDPALSRPVDVAAAPFDSFGRCFEVCQWSPSSYNSQTTRAVAVTETDGADQPRLSRLDFYAATASRFYAPVALGIWCAQWETGTEALGRPGSFAVLSPAQRGEPAPADLDAITPPHYDVSWVAG